MGAKRKVESVAEKPLKRRKSAGKVPEVPEKTNTPIQESSGAEKLPANVKVESETQQLSLEQLKEIVPNHVLFKIDEVEKVHQFLNQLQKDGKIVAKERRILLKRWQSRRRIRKVYENARLQKKDEIKEEKLLKKGQKMFDKITKAHDKDSTSELWSRGILPDTRDISKVKEKLNELASSGELPLEKVGEIVRKIKKSEWRRQRRSTVRAANKLCFSCRQPGHSLADCQNQAIKSEPKESGESGDNEPELQGGICFKCGSTEHAVHRCRAKVKGYPYAKCFVCGKSGHLSRECPSNPRGAFPMGGGCNLCGENTHLKKECPLIHKKKENEPEMKLEIKSDTFQNPDADDANVVVQTANGNSGAEKKRVKKVKVVKF